MGWQGTVLIVGISCLVISGITSLIPYRWFLKIPGYAKLDNKLLSIHWLCKLAEIMYTRQAIDNMRTECSKSLFVKR